MARCQAIKADGERCRAEAKGSAEWCYSHDPARASERSRNARRGGKAGGRGRISEIPEIKSLLSRLTTEVLAGVSPTARYAVANQLINTRLRAVELERKIHETEELEARIEALETKAGVEPNEGRRRWG